MALLVLATGFSLYIWAAPAVDPTSAWRRVVELLALSVMFSVTDPSSSAWNDSSTAPNSRSQGSQLLAAVLGPLRTGLERAFRPDMAATGFAGISITRDFGGCAVVIHMWYSRISSE
ncbi:MAG: hypothetical protein E6J91_11585 [Deltaproteobacteria bacterium]|nr:MAG: hypothetical protein E6J91_11585 [Deltaproteobacteria bacterium]